MINLTIFTPSYNRADLLPKLFNSLKEQSVFKFKWLVIDDGSADKTKELIESYKLKAPFQIDYIYQQNKGMVGAHQTAHEVMDTTLCLCIDSDDYMPKNAIKDILNIWDKYGNDDLAGIIGLDVYEDGEIVGDEFPVEGLKMKFTEMLYKYKVYGDKKFVHNRKVFNKYLPYKFFENEKFPVTSYLYHFIEQEHNWIVFNIPFCVIEYQSDGLSANLFNQYKESPRSWIHYRKTRMQYSYNFKDKFKNTIHYISSNFMINNYNVFKNNKFPIITFLALPFGLGLFVYLTNTKRTGLKKI